VDEKQKDSILYRFSGYQLNKLSLDETGHTYYILPSFIHPYYLNQPEYWSDPVFLAGQAVMGPSSATASTLLSLKTIGATYGSGGSVAEAKEMQESESEEDHVACKSKKLSQEERLEAIKSQKSQKNCKKRLFSLVKI
jgi:hypothetical protein